MSPSKVANATLRRAAAAVPVFALLFACNEKEWDEQPGTLELYATPLPPVAGQPLTLGVVGTNVGPVDIFQGDQRVASLVNVDTSKRVDFQVVAVSNAVPKAVAVAYDFKRLEAQAAAFTTVPRVPDGGLADAGPRDAGASDAGAQDPGPLTDAGTVAWNVSAPQAAAPGSRFEYVCGPNPSEAGAGQVWGTDVYTYDSSICKAGVHAGKITFAAGGAVRIEMRGVTTTFTGSTRNGVITASWSKPEASFVFLP
jgi:LCCL domain